MSAVGECCLHFLNNYRFDLIVKENRMDPIFDLAMIAVVAIMVAFNFFG